MAFRDCILNALAGGEISAQEADEMIATFDRRTGAGEDPSAVKAAISDELRAAAAEERRLLGLTQAARSRIADGLGRLTRADGTPDVVAAALAHIDNGGYASGIVSVAGRTKEVLGDAMGRLDELVRLGRTDAFGRRIDLARIDNVVRELFGEGTGDVVARRLASAWTEVSDLMRRKFNDLGGAVAELKDWRLPQVHDPRKLLAAGQQPWIDFITPKLDLDAMIDPATGGHLGSDRLREALVSTWRRVVTDGTIDVEPSATAAGAGMLAGRRADHRFLKFKSADDWLAYQAAFGDVDAFATFMNHLRGMARDIAAMEVLGPNPDATLRWMKSVVDSERAKVIAGDDSLFRGDPTRAFEKSPAAQIDALWALTRGGIVTDVRMATAFENIRNVAVAAKLGSAVVTAVATDPQMAAIARRFAGLPAVNWLTDVIGTVAADTSSARRAGLILDQATRGIEIDTRWSGVLAGADWSRWLADRSLAMTGLLAWTQKRKDIIGLEMMSAIADWIGSGADNRRLAAWLDDHGIGADRLTDLARSVPRETDGARPILSYRDILDATGDEELAFRYLGAINDFVARAVPETAARARVALGDNGRRGDVGSELFRGVFQFKSFALSYTMNMIESLAFERARFGDRSAASMGLRAVIGLGLTGFLAYQLKQVANGKDLADPKDPKIWINALATGGGLGLFGDFALADVNRYGYSIPETAMGPTGQFFTDGFRTLLAAPHEAAGDGSAKGGRLMREWLQNWMPGASIFYTKLAYQRLLLDQLDALTDPHSHATFRNRQMRLRRETGQEYWWKPGQTAPERFPISAAP